MQGSCLGGMCNVKIPIISFEDQNLARREFSHRQLQSNHTSKEKMSICLLVLCIFNY